MANNDDDVVMNDASAFTPASGDAVASASADLPDTSSLPATVNLPMTSTSTSHHARSDHDRQYFFVPTTTNPLKRSRPHVSQNLIADYGLNPVHERVRRVNATTGEKINKLRKSYVGIVKNMHIAGSNKEVYSPGQWLDTVNQHDPKGLMDKKEVEDGVDIVNNMQVPKFKEVWKVDVPPVSKQAAQSLLAKLGTAVQMAPGKIENGDQWRKLLGEDAVKKPAVPLPASLKAPVTASSARPSPRLGPAAGRTQRTGAKRSYDESSFSGYNETYDDVERAPQADLARKKQRKVPTKSPKEFAPAAAAAAAPPKRGTTKTRGRGRGGRKK